MCALKYSQVSRHLDAEFTGEDAIIGPISTDSRTLQKGDLFIALKGEQFDGHDYVAKAIELGAGGLIVSESVETTLPTLLVKDTLKAFGQLAAINRRRFDIPVVGITGSCGKTSVKEMLASILNQSGKVLATPGNFNNEIGMPTTLCTLYDSHRYAILEMGARKQGDIGYLMDIAKPNVSLITNCGHAHIETFGSLDGVAKAKGEIYQKLSKEGTAVINADDMYAPYLLSLLTDQNILTFGLECMADVTCAYVIQEHENTIFELVTDIGSIQVTLPLLGSHNILNALAAAACARALGIMLEDIKQGLEQMVPVGQRLEVKFGSQGVKIIDDSYNANPSSVKAALEVLAKEAGKKILVLGDMLELGSEAVSQHREVGETAKAQGINVMLGTGELTKSATDGFGNDARYYQNKSSLIDDLLTLIDDQTTVLIKGSRSMHMEDVTNALISNSKD